MFGRQQAETELVDIRWVERPEVKPCLTMPAPCIFVSYTPR
jgi:hypothetical protein